MHDAPELSVVPILRGQRIGRRLKEGARDRWVSLAPSLFGSKIPIEFIIDDDHDLDGAYD